MDFNDNVPVHGRQKGSNALKRLAKRIKDKLIPSTKKERTKRIHQLKDIGIFVGTVVAFMLLEDRIQKLVSVDPGEVQKLTKGGPSLPPAF